MGVVGPENGWDAYVNSMAGEDSFDNLFNILDFPMDSLEENDLSGDWDIESQSLEPIPSNLLIEPLIDNGPLCLASGPAVSLNNPLQISEAQESNQVSECIQVSSNSDIPQHINPHEPRFCHSQSPNSVLESTGSCPTGKSSPKASVRVPVRPRSKRVRAAVNPWLAVSPFVVITPSASNNGSNKKREREPKKKMWTHPVTKVLENNILQPVENSHLVSDKVDPGAATKKCTHCQVTKTPQWREGPAGPKTLCNACGVRYRSGRLFPEYRPAASPTFIPTLHSNSHKKVIEMRTKGRRISSKMNGSVLSKFDSTDSNYWHNYI